MPARFGCHKVPCPLNGSRKLTEPGCISNNQNLFLDEESLGRGYRVCLSNALHGCKRDRLDSMLSHSVRPFSDARTTLFKDCPSFRIQHCQLSRAHDHSSSILVCRVDIRAVIDHNHREGSVALRTNGRGIPMTSQTKGARKMRDYCCFGNRL